MKTKKCLECGTEKELSLYNKNKASKDGRETRCSACRAASKRANRLSKKSGIYESKNSLKNRTALFLNLATSVNKGEYSYERAVYVDNHTPVEIFCKRHKGYFWQIPNSHTNGVGCKECGVARRQHAATKTQEEFMVDCLAKGREEFDYSEAVYKTCRQPVCIICKKCSNKFEQTPVDHFRGNGCPYCANYGYRYGLPGVLYVLIEGDVTKVGITNLTAKQRAAQVTASAIKSDCGIKDLQVLHDWTWEDGSIAFKLEKIILKDLRENCAAVDYKFNGSTECFVNVDRDWLLGLINKKIEELN